jgi:hypothetical protein
VHWRVLGVNTQDVIPPPGHAAQLREVAALLDSAESQEQALLPAVDTLAAEFARNRLPPHPSLLKDAGTRVCVCCVTHKLMFGAGGMRVGGT